jgi:hypothetical protein
LLVVRQYQQIVITISFSFYKHQKKIITPKILLKQSKFYIFEIIFRINMQNNIGFRIKKIREDKRMTQDYLAARLDVTQSNYG